jgi:5-methyltetrahydropteroyltriglutamate--homocysteine methyltransferase
MPAPLCDFQGPGQVDCRDVRIGLTNQGDRMKTSSTRFLTTHVGSMPRSDAVCAALLAKEHGEVRDEAAFDALMSEAVQEVVRVQASLGIDIVSDGETSKIGYATYIKDRNTGFGGDFTPKPHRDLADHPDYRDILAKTRGPQLFRRTCCVGEIAPKNDGSLQKDIANLRRAVAASGVAEAFMNAASPGVVSAFQPNRFYDTDERYLTAIAKVMRTEYLAIDAAGFLLQVDCPDLAMSRHTAFQDLDEHAFLKRAQLHVEVLNRALEGIPKDRIRAHICWGNYEGPHDFDIPLEKIIANVLSIHAGAISFEAANPRHEHEWTIWRDHAQSTDTILMPGVLDTSTNYVEHPELVAQRIERFAREVGPERVIASTDCGFGTFVGSVAVARTVAYKKLTSLVEGARIASMRMYGKAGA